MPRNFDWSSLTTNARTQGIRFWLQATLAVLAVANIVALFFYIAPPGGTRKQLIEEDEQMHRQVVSSRFGAARLRNVAGKVQSGSQEAGQFQNSYFLPKRTAYDSIIAEIQRMAKDSGLQQREAVFSEEPIEGSADLTLLNITSSYQGTYDNLMQFLLQTDKSPMLLMLDTLQAVPQQHGPQISASIRFQAIVREESAALHLPGGQP